MAHKGEHEGKVIVVAGYSPVGISHAVAKLFGTKGFKVALLARTQEALHAGVKELKSAGVTAHAFPVDLSIWENVKHTIENVRKELGKITIVFWNAYKTFKYHTISDITLADLTAEFNLNVAGLIAAVQASLDDLKAQKGESAVLITGGGLSLENDQTAETAIAWGAPAPIITKAGQRKAAHLLNKALAKDGVYVGEVTVLNPVKGTNFDPESKSSLTTDAVALSFWELYTNRASGNWNVLKGA